VDEKVLNENLSRIPFSRAEEQTIGSMARWMRFMAVVGIVGAFLLLFFAVLGLGLLAVAQGLGEDSPKWAERMRSVNEVGPMLYALLAVFLLAALVSLWQNFALYRAGDHFHAVAATDVADLDYLARGLDKLRIYFKVQVLVVIVTVGVAFGAALTLVALARHAS
jgi:hypothetical protein